jgi:hypothetical protein
VLDLPERLRLCWGPYLEPAAATIIFDDDVRARAFFEALLAGKMNQFRAASRY